MILFLEPYFEVKPWAGKELNNLYKCPESTGEAWIVSAYEGKSSVIKNSIYEGKNLLWLWNNHRNLFGKYDCDFPILIKLISSSEKLSVQVHPDDEYAIEKCNSYGKFECWYILPETRNDKIIIGTHAKSKEQMINAIETNVEDILNDCSIEAHDLVVVEPGTVHAIKEDTFLLEVQESSDITYRLYDYNREPKRELHVQQALDVIKYNQSDLVLDFKNNSVMKSKHFNVKKINVKDYYTAKLKSFVVVYVVSGSGIANGKTLNKGDSFIITIDSEYLQVTGDLQIIIIYPKAK